MNKCTCTQTEKNVRKGVVKERFEHKKRSSLRLDDYDYEISFYSFQRFQNTINYFHNIVTVHCL